MIITKNWRLNACLKMLSFSYEEKCNVQKSTELDTKGTENQELETHINRAGEKGKRTKTSRLPAATLAARPSPRGAQTRPSQKKHSPGARFKQSNRPLWHSPPTPLRSPPTTLSARADPAASDPPTPGRGRRLPSRADSRAHAETGPRAAPQAPSGVALRVPDGSLTSPPHWIARRRHRSLLLIAPAGTGVEPRRTVRD